MDVRERWTQRTHPTPNRAHAQKTLKRPESPQVNSLSTDWLNIPLFSRPTSVPILFPWLIHNLPSSTSFSAPPLSWLTWTSVTCTSHSRPPVCSPYDHTCFPVPSWAWPRCSWAQEAGQMLCVQCFHLGRLSADSRASAALVVPSDDQVSSRRPRVSMQGTSTRWHMSHQKGSGAHVGRHAHTHTQLCKDTHTHTRTSTHTHNYAHTHTC